MDDWPTQRAQYKVPLKACGNDEMASRIFTNILHSGVMSVKNKAILLVSAVILLLSVFYHFHVITAYNKTLDLVIQHESEEFNHLIELTQQYSLAPLQAEVKIFIDQEKEWVRAFAEHDRQILEMIAAKLSEVF